MNTGIFYEQPFFMFVHDYVKYNIKILNLFREGKILYKNCKQKNLVSIYSSLSNSYVCEYSLCMLIFK